MTSKFKIITTGIFLAAVTVIIYFIYRIDIIEHDFIKSASAATGDITGAYKKFLEERKKATSAELSDFLNALNKKYPGVAYLAVTDMNYAIRLASKNDRFIKSGEMNNILMDDIAGRKLTVQGNRAYISRYYDLKRDGKKDEQKFYIFNKIVMNSRILIFFPYEPRNRVILRVILEISLILLFYVILTALVYMVSRGSAAASPPQEPVAESIDLTEGAVSTRINLSAGVNTIEAEEAKISAPLSSVASDTLNSHVLNLFSSLNKRHSLDSLSLYIKNQDNRLAKSFEYKGRTFIRIDSANFDTIDLESTIGRELKKSTIIFMDNNSRVILPVAHDSSLVGVLSLIKGAPFTGSDIDAIKNELLKIAGPLSDYLVVNRVMVDNGTGLYSKQSFQVKFNELARIAEGGGAHFSVMFITLIEETAGMAPADRSSIIKLLSPVVSKLLKGDSSLAVYDEYIGVLLPGAGQKEAMEAGEKIVAALSKYRIKVDKDRTVQITPRSGTASSEKVRSGGMINAAMSRMK